VLRVAILYGFIESPSESAVTTLLSNVLATDVVCSVDNVQRRFPTHCDDVAVVIRQLLDKCNQVWFGFALCLYDIAVIGWIFCDPYAISH